MVGSSLVGWHLVNPSTCFLSYLHNVIKTRTVKTCCTNFLFDLVCTYLAFHYVFFYCNKINLGREVSIFSIYNLLHGVYNPES